MVAEPTVAGMDNTRSSQAVPTRDQALAVRPNLDDPTHLTNGHPHPRYIEWITRYSYAEQHPLSEFLYERERLHPITDDGGYFDRKRVKAVLGASGPKMWVPDGPLPTKAKIPLLAQLLDVSEDKVAAVVQRDREVRKEYQSILSACRMLPYRLLTYEQTMAGVPCPGCGRPWTGPPDEFDADERRWEEEHGECHAGRNSLGEGPTHCLRCCGFPAISPEILAKVRGIFTQAAKRVEEKRQSEDRESPEALQERAEKEGIKRRRRIKALETELAKLREEDTAEELR